MSLSLIGQCYDDNGDGDSGEEEDNDELELEGGKDVEGNVFENDKTDYYNSNVNGEDNLDFGGFPDIEVKVELLELDGEIVIEEDGGEGGLLETSGAEFEYLLNEGREVSQEMKTDGRGRRGDLGDDDDKTDENSQKVDVDLNQMWPFTRCRVVVQLDEDDGGGGVEASGRNLKEGWEMQGTRHTFYDKITSREVKEISEQLPPVMQTTLSRSQRNNGYRQRRPSHCRGTQSGQGQNYFAEGDPFTQNRTDRVVDAVFKCPFCLKIFSEGGRLIQHLAAIHNLYERKTSDPIISKTEAEEFNDANPPIQVDNYDDDSPPTPAKDYDDNDPIKAEVFIDDSPTKEPVYIQIPSRRGKKQFQCTNCGKVFAKAYQAVKHHKIVHSGKKPFKCDICPAAFPSSTGLRRHVESTHLRLKRHSCTQCDKEFYDRAQLDRHMFTHSGNRPRPFKCSLCPKDFMDRGALRRHVLTHSGNRVRPFKCDLCSKDFTDGGSLRRHLITHTGTRPFKCTLCPKDFTDTGSLRRHVQTHTEDRDRPFKCELCPKDFIDRKALTIHMMSHTGEKPFGCTKCSWRFSTSTALKRHQLAHSGRRNHKCDDCGLRFKHKTTLRRHQVQQKHFPEAENDD